MHKYCTTMRFDFSEKKRTLYTIAMIYNSRPIVTFLGVNFYHSLERARDYIVESGFIYFA